MSKFWKIFPIAIFILIGMAMYLFVMGISHPENDEIDFIGLVITGLIAALIGKYIGLPIGEMF